MCLSSVKYVSICTSDYLDINKYIITRTCKYICIYMCSGFKRKCPHLNGQEYIDYFYFSQVIEYFGSLMRFHNRLNVNKGGKLWTFYSMYWINLYQFNRCIT